MKEVNFKILLVSVFTFIVTVSVTAQEVYTLNEKNSTLRVTGTSTLHDWEMAATEFSAETGLKVTGNSVSEIQYINFSVPVSALESGKNTLDRKAHEALEEKKFPLINFTLNGENPTDVSGGNAMLEGKLTVAGKTRQIKVPVSFDNVSDRQFNASGKVSLDMADFGIEPPSALFGTITADKEVEVLFDFELSSSR